MVNCLECEKEINEKDYPKSKKPRKFCCDNCAARFRARTYYREKGNVWAKNNPEKRARIQRNNYQNNKEKCICRNNTRSVMATYGKKCRDCPSTEDLEVHHEVYPTTVEGIKKALDEGKIYILCGKCHKLTYKTQTKDL